MYSSEQRVNSVKHADRLSGAEGRMKREGGEGGGEEGGLKRRGCKGMV